MRRSATSASICIPAVYHLTVSHMFSTHPLHQISLIVTEAPHLPLSQAVITHVMYLSTCCLSPGSMSMYNAIVDKNRFDSSSTCESPKKDRCTLSAQSAPLKAT